MPPDRVPVACIARWTSGTSGTFACTAGGAHKADVKLSDETVHLEKICVNDPRITTYGFGNGQTAPIDAKGDPPGRCGMFNGAQRLPATCSCSGADCTPPKDGFVCFAAGWVPLGGH